MNQLSHLEELEAEAIYIMREVVAEFIRRSRLSHFFMWIPHGNSTK